MLLNPEWYNKCMRPVMARWMQLWLEANHVAGLSSEQIEAYITSDGSLLRGSGWEPWVYEAAAAREAKSGVAPAGGAVKEVAAAALSDESALRLLHAFMEAKVDQKGFKLLNLTAEWLRTYLPHCLQKIDRVSFGLLSIEEVRSAGVAPSTPCICATASLRNLKPCGGLPQLRVNS